MKKEQEKNLNILQSIIGTSIPLEPKKANFRDMSVLHYDPKKENHRDYEIRQKREPMELISEESKKKRKGEAESSKLPEVSKDIYYEISEDLKAAFSSNENREVISFNFFSGDKCKDSDLSNFKSKEDEEGEKNIEQKVKWKSSIFNILSATCDEEKSNSDHERTDNDWLLSREEIEEANNKNNNSCIQSENERFFFSKHDKRLEEGVKLFCCTHSEEALLDWWEKEKPEIEQINNKRYKQAIKLAKKNNRKKRNIKH